MRNRYVMTLALTALLSLGGTALANTPRAAKLQNTNSGGSTTSTGKTTRRKATHHKRHRARKHVKTAAAANANR